MALKSKNANSTPSREENHQPDHTQEYSYYQEQTLDTRNSSHGKLVIFGLNIYFSESFDNFKCVHTCYYITLFVCHEHQ